MNKKYILFFSLVAIITLSIGCTKKYNFQDVGEMIIYEPMDEDYAPIIFKPVKISRSKYDLYIDSTIGEKNRISYIKFMEEMLEKINANEKYTYYVCDKFSNRVTDGIIYLKYSESYKSSTFLIFSLQKKFGVTANYGLLYGYSNYLMGSRSNIEIERLRNISGDERSIFDMTLPLFMNEYTKSEIIDLTKSVSKGFVEYIILKKGKDNITNLIKQSTDFDNEFEKMLTNHQQEWLESINLDIELCHLDIPIRYSNVSNFYPLKIETEWMEYYFQYQFLEKQEHIFAIRFTNFFELRDFLVVTENQMQQARDFIGGDYSVEKYGKPHIYYVPDYADNSKKQKNADATLHEYVHFITSDSMYRNMHASYLVEGIANYIHYTYNTVAVQFEKESLENYIPSPSGDSSQDQFVLGYKQYMKKKQFRIQSI